jgi:hypothetical protein
LRLTCGLRIKTTTPAMTISPRRSPCQAELLTYHNGKSGDGDSGSEFYGRSGTVFA